MADCSKRTAWTSAFFACLVLALTGYLLAVITPSWQYVYLEDGRTEHHHGLWLDCKRDYSNEYGRPREFYESLYRIRDLQGPFDQFSLPKLQCVYKFDYWLDDEDWYEHGYDENRLQGDAYQHLFIGWKIAALTAHCIALACTLIALIVLCFAFCHRLLICVAAVLITLAVIGCLIGNVVFFMYANYQDNNIIKEEDGIYEQYFGWSFYTSLISNSLLLIASIIGCVATSSIFSSGPTRLVKIGLDSFNDSATLLHMGRLNAGMDPSQSVSSVGDLAAGSSNKFKRSASAVYKIDAAALRKWERNAMRNAELINSRDAAFKRANSMPNIKKGSRQLEMSNSGSSIFRQSNSSLSKAFVDSYSHQFLPSTNRRHPSMTPSELGIHPPKAHPDGGELIYEYVDHNSLSNAPYNKFRGDSTINSRQNFPSTALNTYDRVPPFDSQSGFNNGSRANLIGGEVAAPETDYYLKPRSVTSSRSGSFNKTSDIPMFSTGNFEFKPSKQPSPQKASTQSFFEHEIFERQERNRLTTTFNSAAAPIRPRPNAKELDTPNVINQSAYPRPKIPPKPPQRTSRTHRCPSPSAPPLTLQKNAASGIPLNTFQSFANDAQPRSRSITNLVAVGSDQASSVSVFDDCRESTTDFDSTTNHTPRRGGASLPFSYTAALNLGRLKETNFDSTSSSYAPSEMDRSMGSTHTFLATNNNNNNSLSLDPDERYRRDTLSSNERTLV